MGNCLAHESPQRPSKPRPHVASIPLNHSLDCKPPAAEAKRQPPATKGATAAATEKKHRKVRFADDVLDGDSKKNNRVDIDKRDVVRVKMVLTKKEAALLLSVLAPGGGNHDGAALERLLCEAHAAAKGSPAREGRDGWRPAALERTPEQAERH